jgi:WD40 repeat protein
VQTFKPHKKPIYALAFSPDGAKLATSSGDETVSLWPIADPSAAKTFPGSKFASPISLSPDGRFLARGGYGVAVWDTESGAAVISDEMYAQTVAFAPDGGEIAALGSGRALKRWELPKGKKLPGGWGGDRTPERFPAGALAYSPDGTVLATTFGVLSVDRSRFDSYHLLWDRKTGTSRGELVADFKFDHPGVIAFSPDGSVIAGNYGPVLGVTEVKSGAKVAAIKPGTKHFKGLAFTPDGARLIAVNTDAAVRVYDTATWAETTGYEWDIGKLTAVAVAPDGLRAACGSDRGRVVVWDLE